MPAPTPPSHRIGVVLFQLGGPDSIDAVEPFLYNLFSDPDIIDFPLASIARRPLARLIAKSRARHAARDDPDFVDSVVAAVNRSLADFPHPQEELDFVFSAHSLPVAVVQAGDPYQQQIEHTCDMVWKAGGWRGRRHLCYQSKVGTAKWL